MNRGSVFEPWFSTVGRGRRARPPPRRCPPPRHPARRVAHLPRPRLRRRRHAGHRGRRRSLAGQPVQLLPREERNPVLLSGSLARPAAAGARPGAHLPRTARPAPPRARDRPRALPHRPRRRVRRASRGRCPPRPPAHAHRRQTRSVRARRPRTRGRRHPARRAAPERRDRGDARVSRRPQLDGALVSPRRPSAARPRRRRRGRLRRRGLDRSSPCRTPTSR